MDKFQFEKILANKLRVSGLDGKTSDEVAGGFVMKISSDGEISDSIDTDSLARELLARLRKEPADDSADLEIIRGAPGFEEDVMLAQTRELDLLSIDEAKDVLSSRSDEEIRRKKENGIPAKVIAKKQKLFANLIFGTIRALFGIFVFVLAAAMLAIGAAGLGIALFEIIYGIMQLDVFTEGGMYEVGLGLIFGAGSILFCKVCTRYGSRAVSCLKNKIDNAKSHFAKEAQTSK